MKNCLGGGAHNVALALRGANPVVSVKERFLFSRSRSSTVRPGSFRREDLPAFRLDMNDSDFLDCWKAQLRVKKFARLAPRRPNLLMSPCGMAPRCQARIASVSKRGRSRGPFAFRIVRRIRNPSRPCHRRHPASEASATPSLASRRPSPRWSPADPRSRRRLAAQPGPPWPDR
jgi:hypothetical protein